MSMLSDKLTVACFVMFYVAGQWIPRPSSLAGGIAVGVILLVAGWFVLGAASGFSRRGGAA